MPCSARIYKITHASDIHSCNDLSRLLSDRAGLSVVSQFEKSLATELPMPAFVVAGMWPRVQAAKPTVSQGVRNAEYRYVAAPITQPPSRLPMTMKATRFGVAHLSSTA